AQCLAKLPAIKPSPFGPAAGARSLQIESTSAPTFDVLRPPGSVLIWSLHHFIARHDAPKIRGRRILLPDLGALRTVAMPRPRLEIAERFVHLVELGKGLSDQAVRRAMIGEQIVTDAVAARAPQQLVAVEAEIVARLLHVRPIAQLEGGVEMAVRAGLHQVDGMMVGAAAQEREEVRHPVGLAEAKHVAIELGH